MGHRLAIDFGTTNSLVVRWDESRRAAEVLELAGLSAPAGAGGLPLIPSLLYVRDGQTADCAAGHAVRQQMLERRRDNRLFRNFKRGITAGVEQEPRLLDGIPWDDRQAGMVFLRSLFQALPYPAAAVETIVLTVPVGAQESFAGWINRAVAADLREKVRIVDESTAAALGYAVTEPGERVLVIDFGGGTLDLSLVTLPQSQRSASSLLSRLVGREKTIPATQVIAKAGVTLGGSDIDRWLMGEVLQRTGISPLDLGGDFSILLAACEQAKIALSTEQTARIDLVTASGRSRSVEIHRAELEDLLTAQGFFTGLRRAVEKVLSAAHRRGVYREDVGYVFMVGGTSLIPAVQRTLQEFFPPERVRVDRPFTAIAEGALQVAAGYGLQDYLVHSYGLRYLDAASRTLKFDEIIPMGSAYPLAKPVAVLLSAAHPRQTEMDLVVAQMDGAAIAAVEVVQEGGQTVFLAQPQFSGAQIHLQGRVIVPLQPPAYPGKDRLRVTFSVDEQRQLRVSAFDLQTRRDLLTDVRLADLGGETAGAVDGGKDIPAAAPCLSSPRQDGRYRLSLRSLATTLNLLPPEAVSLEVLAAALQSPDCLARYAAAEKISLRGDRDARRLVEEALATAPAPARASMVHHLHRFTWLSAEPLLRRALADPDLRVRESAVFALCRLRQPEAVRLAAEALAQGTEGMFLAAVYGVQHHPDAAAVTVLEKTLAALDTATRILALELLGQAEDAAAALPVIRHTLLHDPENEVKYAAVLSFVELTGEDGFAELADIIRRARGWERRWLLRGFFHATNYLLMEVGKSRAIGEVITMLEAALEDDLPEARLQAGMMLAWLRHPMAEFLLRRAYHNETVADIRARLLVNAVDLMSPLRRELLADALTSPSILLRLTAEFLQRERQNTLTG